LRSANEELLVGNEESQAAMEEIETLNEEQQATNEELETLNEELQATVEELNTTNDDLQARGAELQSVAHALDEERSRLAAVLGSMAEGVLVVDSEGKPVLSNDAFKRTFASGLNEIEDDDGRPLGDHMHPIQRAARGEVFRVQFTLRDGDRRHRFEATGRPIRVDSVQGGVIVVHDIAERAGSAAPQLPAPPE
jgi:two-component system CheB/CheR fusion protein